MRLAHHVECTTDVDGMLDRMTPEQFSEWEAYDTIQPIDHTPDMLGLIAWMISSYISEEPVEREWYMPWLKGAKTAAGTATGKEFMKKQGFNLQGGDDA